eukprot:6264837-Amphidinium_carterae.2
MVSDAARNEWHRRVIFRKQSMLELFALAHFNIALIQPLGLHDQDCGRGTVSSMVESEVVQ